MTTSALEACVTQKLENNPMQNAVTNRILVWLTKILDKLEDWILKILKNLINIVKKFAQSFWDKIVGSGKLFPLILDS